MKWTELELTEIQKAVENIRNGASIYSQVKKLHCKTSGALFYRSWSSIRSKINTFLLLRK
jgi:hypothetical protein